VNEEEEEGGRSLKRVPLPLSSSNHPNHSDIMSSSERQHQPHQKQLYHERQAFGRQLCAAHSLNNLTQSRAFSAGAVDAVARALASGGAQRTPFFGNHDVNVLQAAASQIAQIELSYFDARRAQSDGELEALVAARGGGGGGDGGGSAVVGLVLNVAVPGWWGRLRGARHWLALLPVEEEDEGLVAWYNLDSMLASPERIGGAEETAAFLRRALDEGATLLVARRGSDEPRPD
jgi:hypothetical protein